MRSTETNDKNISLIEEASKEAQEWVNGKGGVNYFSALGMSTLKAAIKTAYFNGYVDSRIAYLNSKETIE